MRRLSVVSLLLLLTSATGTLALEFRAPAADAVFKPGTSVRVLLAASPSEVFTRVAVLASGREVEAAPVPGEPGMFQVDVAVPLDVVGPTYLVAFGEGAEGLPAMDARRISVDPGAITRLILSAPSQLSGVGREARISLLAQFEDGIFRDVTSPQTGTTYSAGEGNVVKVYPEGFVLSCGRGADLLIASNRGVATAARITVTVSPDDTNQLPIADAGPDQTVVSESVVVLSGAASSDPDGGALVYRWRQVSGRAVMLVPNNAPETGDPAESLFVAPAVTAPQVLEFRLMVRDAKGAVSMPDTVRVTVIPKT